MVALVSQARAAAHLRLDLPQSGSEDDAGDAVLIADLDAKIEQASAIIVDYLKNNESGWVEDDTPEHIQAATLLLLSDLWEHRIETDKGDYIKPGGTIARLLHRSRDPAMA